MSFISMFVAFGSGILCCPEDVATGAISEMHIDLE